MSAAAVGISRVRLAPLRVRRCSVTLHYPESWAARPNPMAGELGRLVEARMGGRCARELEVGLGANWAFPFAEGERAEVITQRFAEWACGVREGALVGASTGEYLRRRRAEMRVEALVELLEYQLGWALPAEVDVRELMEAAADCVAIGRELIGHGALVDCVMREFGDDAGEAFKWVANMHTRQVRRVRELEGALLERHAAYPMLMAWVDALHCMIYGLAQWHSRAGRFQAVREMAGWKIAVNVSPACPDPFELP